MSPITEVVTIFLEAGIDIDDQSSPAFQIAKESFSTISNQPGFQSMYYGPELEDASILQLFIDWESIEKHKQFMTSPDYGPFLSTIGKLFAKTPSLFHFSPKTTTGRETEVPKQLQSPTAILGTAPVIEVATFFQTEESFVSNVEKFMDTISPRAEGLLGSVYGDVLEEIEKEEGTGKGRAVFLCIGWENMEKHMAFRETEAFAENIHFLREGVKGAEMHHVALKSIRRHGTLD